ncbi:53 kda brg1-associated factor b [Papiliotrema laurentii]|uniref:53 kDa brg1-associated factor b n=1 Tax=Papiliotrema laurentii TaxID=5418 RepID=A0AAD9FS96_PAPLA|nr:53 kda brg1-associated factor b [Papiliotrema laurentii]
MVYNGDEVSALVVDFGSHTTRAGYAGEDCPRVVCPSFYGYTEEASTSNGTNTNGGAPASGEDAMDVDAAPVAAEGAANGEGASKKRKYYVGEDGVGVWRPNMEVGNFMLDGVVHEFEPASQLLHHILHDRLSVDPTEHPLMITEPAWNTPQSREKLAELVFEGEGVPATYFGSNGVLSAFAAGKPTALVLDVGYANSSAVPIVDGYALRAGTKRQPLGSQLILSQLRAHFTTPTTDRPFLLSLAPRHLIAKRVPTPEPGTQPTPIFRQDRLDKTTESWRSWAENTVVDNWREACGEIVSHKGFDFATAKDLPSITYEFPDGYCGIFGEERYRFNEILFDPKNYFNQNVTPPAALRTVETGPHAHSLKDLVSLSQLVHDSIMACDVDVRASLLQNIVVVGNTSLTRGFTERLDLELAGLMPSQKIKIHSPIIPFERKYASWVGGSILSSLGTFHQLWITKEEYQEHGAAIIHQRCK